MLALDCVENRTLYLIVSLTCPLLYNSAFLPFQRFNYRSLRDPTQTPPPALTLPPLSERVEQATNMLGAKPRCRN